MPPQKPYRNINPSHRLSLPRRCDIIPVVMLPRPCTKTRPAARTLHMDEHCIKGKSVEPPLIGSRAFHTTQRKVFAPATESRVRYTFFLQQNQCMWPIQLDGVHHRRNFDRLHQSSTDSCAHQYCTSYGHTVPEC